MDQFYKVAGLQIQMSTFGKTKERAYQYRWHTCMPDMTIESDWKRVKEKQPHFSDEDCEYVISGAEFARKLLTFDGLVLHASAVVVDGYAYLFSAKSGTGKSTHTRLWLDRFGDRAYILNDDKPALRLENGVWYAYGTPWSGKHDISVNTRVPVKGICILHQASENSIRPFSGTEAIFEILAQTRRPADPVLRAKLMELLDKLLTMAPVWEMGCNMDPEAAMVSYEAMSQGRKDANL